MEFAGQPGRRLTCRMGEAINGAKSSASGGVPRVRNMKLKFDASSKNRDELLHERTARAILSKGIRSVTTRLGSLSVLATYQLADAFDVKYERPKPRGVPREQTPH